MRRLALFVVLLLPSTARAQGPARLTLIDDWQHNHIVTVAALAAGQAVASKAPPPEPAADSAPVRPVLT